MSAYRLAANEPFFRAPSTLVGRRVRFRSIAGPRRAGREGVVLTAGKTWCDRTPEVTATVLMDDGAREPMAALDSFEVLPVPVHPFTPKVMP